MQISQVGIDLIKHCEGVRLETYKCSAGVNTIGYGHTKGVKEGMTITEEQAEDFLREDLEYFVKEVNRLVKVDLEQHQFDACVSFTFNVGVRNFEKSTLLKEINTKDFESASAEFLKWNKAKGKTLKGLTYRRELERKLFLGFDVLT